MHRGQPEVAGMGGEGACTCCGPRLVAGSKEGKAEHSFQADPHPMLLTTHALGSPLVCKTPLVLPVPLTQRKGCGKQGGG